MDCIQVILHLNSPAILIHVLKFSLMNSFGHWFTILKINEDFILKNSILFKEYCNIIHLLVKSKLLSNSWHRGSSTLMLFSGDDVIHPRMSPCYISGAPFNHNSLQNQFIPAANGVFGDIGFTLSVHLSIRLSGRFVFDA